MFSRTKGALVAALAAAILTTLAVPGPQADLIVQHLGSTDPTTEGWTLRSGSDCSASAVNDNGTLAWQIVDGGSDNGEYWDYYTGLSSYLNDPNGWTATLGARVVSNPYAYRTGVGLWLTDSADTWWLNLVGGDSTPSNNGIWYLDSSANLTQFYQMDTSSAYHTYQLIYNPTYNDRASVYVDGVKIGDLLRSQVYNDSASAYAWGADSSPGTGTGNYNYAAFETGQHPVPEASTLALFGVGLAALAVVRWRRRRRHQPEA